MNAEALKFSNYHALLDIKAVNIGRVREDFGDTLFERKSSFGFNFWLIAVCLRDSSPYKANLTIGNVIPTAALIVPTTQQQQQQQHLVFICFETGSRNFCFNAHLHCIRFFCVCGVTAHVAQSLIAVMLFVCDMMCLFKVCRRFAGNSLKA